MSYLPMRKDRSILETIPESKEVDLGDGSDSDIESGQADADETTSFMRRRTRVSIPRLLRNKSQSRARDESAIAPLISSLLPWVINLILAIALVSLSWKKDLRTPSKSHLPPTDLLWSKLFARNSRPVTRHVVLPLLTDTSRTAMAQDRIQYRLEKTYASQHSPQSEYQGWPNDKTDELWEQYEKGNSLRIDKQTAERLPYTTEHVPVEDHEQEYVVSLAVFHQLHCLNVVRKALWPGRYNSSLLDADGSVNYDRWSYIDHCIEVVRRCITCHSDLAAVTYDWVEDSQLVIHQETLHTCRNFDLISEWAYARSSTAPMRSHVEDGRVVSYLDKPYGPAWEKVRTKKPEGWNYTEEDF